MDLNFFSWNVQKNRSLSIYTDLATELANCRTDILVMQECYIDLTAWVPDFIEIADFAKEAGSNTLRIFLNRNSGLTLDKPTSYVNNKQRCVLLKASDGFAFNLVGVHLYSMAGKSDLQQLTENGDVGQNLAEYTLLTGNDKTVIVGDFNLVPFSPVLQSPFIFNAIPVKEVVREQVHRRLAKQDHAYFYNPMWNLIGDYDFKAKSEKISGTYYMDTVDPAVYQWNLLDQVALSKTVMDNLDMESLQIVTSVNGKTLLHSKPSGDKNSYIDHTYSDHLPIKFTLKTT